MGGVVAPAARSAAPVEVPRTRTVLHSSGSPMRLKMQLTCIGPHASDPVFVSVKEMLGTSLFLPSSVIPASYQPVAMGVSLQAFVRSAERVQALAASARTSIRAARGRMAIFYSCPDAAMDPCTHAPMDP